MNVLRADARVVEALQKAGFDHLSPSGQAYLQRRLEQAIELAQGGILNLGGVRDLGYGGHAGRPGSPAYQAGYKAGQKQFATLLAAVHQAEKSSSISSAQIAQLTDSFYNDLVVLFPSADGKRGVKDGWDQAHAAAKGKLSGVEGNNRSVSLTSFGSADDAARALVQIAYRAAPRDWTEVGDAEMAALDRYPVLEEVSVKAADAYPGFDADRLGPLGLGMAEDGSLVTLALPDGAVSWADAIEGTLVTSPLGSDGLPTSAAMETFRKLAADWEAFDRMGVGGAILPELASDAKGWRAMRDAWTSGRLSSAAIGGALASEKVRATKVRHMLRDARLSDRTLDRDPIVSTALTNLGAASDAAREDDDDVIEQESAQDLAYRGRKVEPGFFDWGLITPAVEIAPGVWQQGERRRGAFWEGAALLGKFLISPTPLLSSLAILYLAYDLHDRSVKLDRRLSHVELDVCPEKTSGHGVVSSGSFESSG